MGLFANLKSRVATTLKIPRVRTRKAIVFNQKSGAYFQKFKVDATLYSDISLQVEWVDVNILSKAFF